MIATARLFCWIVGFPVRYPGKRWAVALPWMLSLFPGVLPDPTDAAESAEFWSQAARSCSPSEIAIDHP